MKIVLMFLFSCITFTALSQSIDQSIHLPYKPSPSTSVIGVGISGTALYTYPNYPITNYSYGNTSRVCYIIDGVSVDSIFLDNHPELMSLPIYTSLLSTAPLNTKLNRWDFDMMPYYTINEIVATNPCVRQLQRGDRLNIRNGGEEGTLYVLDGVTLMR